MHAHKTLLISLALAMTALLACGDNNEPDDPHQSADMGSPDIELDQAEDDDHRDAEFDVTDADSADLEPSDMGPAEPDAADGHEDEEDSSEADLHDAIEDAAEPDLDEEDFSEEDLQDMPEATAPVIGYVTLSPQGQTLRRGMEIQLRVTLAENQGAASNYRYRWTQTEGGALDFSSNAPYNLTLTLPLDQDVVGDVEIEVVAINGQLESEPYPVRFTIFNIQPRAQIQAPSHVPPGRSVSLLGGGSYDSDGDPLTYRWTQRSGAPVTLSDPTAPQPTFIAPGELGELGFELVVNDGLEDSEVASVVVAVSDYEGQDAIFERNPFRHHHLEEINFVTATWRDQTMLARTGEQALLTVDVSNPENPVVLGELEGVGQVGKPVWLGDRAFLRSRESITAIDLSDLSQPTVLGQGNFDTGFTLSPLVGHGNLLATITEQEEILLVDVSDPEEMTLVHTLELPQTPTYLAMAEGVLFVGTEGDLVTIDVSNPSAPVTLQELEVSSDGQRLGYIVLHNQLAWMKVGSSHTVGVDISDPSQMEVVSRSRWQTGSGQPISATDDRLVVDNGLEGVGVFDISDLANPRLLHTFNDVEFASNAHIQGERMLLPQSDGGLLGLNWNQANPWVADHLLLRPTNAMVTKPGLAALGWQEEDQFRHGIYLLDTSNPDALRIVTEHEMPGSRDPIPLDLDGDTLYTCEASINELKAWDLSNPAQPQAGPVLPNGQCHWLGARYGQHLYGAYGSRGFNILDTSQALEPTRVGMFDSDAAAINSHTDLQIQGDHLFHLYGYGLEIYSLEDPTHPVLLSRLENFPDSFFAIDLDGDRAYVSTVIALLVLDIEQPDTPRILGRAPLMRQRRFDRDGRSLARVDDIAVVDLDNSGLLLMDISSDNRPRVLGQVDTMGTGSVDLRDRVAALPGRRVLLRDAETVITSMRLPTTQGSFTEDTPLVAAPEQTLTATFTGFDPQYELACAVSGGSCRVLSVDSGNQRATIEWTLPEVLGDYELAIAHGNEHFWIIDDRVRLTVQP